MTYELKLARGNITDVSEAQDNTDDIMDIAVMMKDVIPVRDLMMFCVVFDEYALDGWTRGQMSI